MRTRLGAVGVAGATGVTLALGALAACGSRTGLPGLDELDAAPPPDHAVSRPDTGPADDQPAPRDVSGEEIVDAVLPDVVVVNPCPDAEATLIYVIGTSTNTLYSFDPTTNSFTTIGVIACPGSMGMPFSMAVDRKGVAYVAFAQPNPDGTTEVGTGLFKVSTRTAECVPTSYDPKKYGSPTFGMGFVADVTDGGVGEGGGDAAPPGETLYISNNNGSSDGELFTLDTTTFTRQTVGLYAPTVQMAELTGTGLGQLYAFQPYIPPGSAISTSGGYIFEIDKHTAKVQATYELVTGGGDLQAGNGWAFAFWGSFFYTFTGPVPAGPTPTTVVHRFDPMKKSLVKVATLTTDGIVGAGVSTCAPF